MLAFLKHKLSHKEKFFAKWGVVHLALALLIGGAIAGWLVINQEKTMQAKVGILSEVSAQAAQDPMNNVPPNAGNIGGPFNLVNQDNKPVTDKDYSGKYLLVYFGYTSCPDMCPTGLDSMSHAIDALKKDDADKVQPIFITVDPPRDTPQRLKQYDASFSPRIVGLTGTPDQIANVAKEYQVFYQKGEGNEDYTVDHSSVIYLMGPDGKLLTTFTEDADPKDIVSALQKVGVGG